ncbi:MAG: sle [Actinomycetia bacterium]|nr:sle [Actinomycetes bacterium]
MRFPAELASVSGARRFVRSCLVAWGHEAETDTAVLLTSEVVTNAIVHGPQLADAEVNLQLRLTTHRVRIEVFDGGVVLPAVAGVDADELSGRGLFMVDTMASHWGVTPNPFGKSVWFEVDTAVEPYLVLPAA